MLILDKLRNQADFTATEKRIADYVLQNLTTIPDSYIQNLATKTYTSHSAIIRLCKKLGFHGFREFKTAIAETVYSQMHTMHEVDVNFPFKPTDAPMIIAKKLSDLTTSTVQKAMMQLDNKLLNNAVDILLSSKRIFLFSQGDSQLRARSFQNKLIKINKFSIIAEEYVDETWNAVNLTPEDCAFFISYRGAVPLYKNFIEYFHSEKIPTIVLTGNPQSPLLKYSDVKLITIQDEYDFAKIATFSSQTAFEYILDTLFSALYVREYRKNIISLKKKQTLMQNGILSNNKNTTQNTDR